MAMDVTKPYKFIGFGAMDVTKPYKFIGFRAGRLPSSDQPPRGSLLEAASSKQLAGTLLEAATSQPPRRSLLWDLFFIGS